MPVSSLNVDAQALRQLRKKQIRPVKSCINKQRYNSSTVTCNCSITRGQGARARRSVDAVSTHKRKCCNDMLFFAFFCQCTNNIQLSHEWEVKQNTGGYITRREVSRYLASTTHSRLTLCFCDLSSTLSRFCRKFNKQIPN